MTQSNDLVQISLVIILLILALVVITHVIINSNKIMNKEDYGECEGRKIRIDDDYREEGTCGIDRVRCERLPWYHNTNRIIDQYDKIDDDEIDDKSLCCIKTATKKNKNKNKECFEIKFGDYYEGDFPINEPKVNDRQDTKTIDSFGLFAVLIILFKALFLLSQLNIFDKISSCFG